MSTIRDYLNELEQDFILLEPAYYDEAIVGLTEGAGNCSAICYDRTKVIELLMSKDGMDRDEAEDFFDFNIAGAYVGEASPVFLTPVSELPIS